MIIYDLTESKGSNMRRFFQSVYYSFYLRLQFIMYFRILRACILMYVLGR